MLVEAIVPLKSLASSKHRLSGVLSCVDRRALVMAMADDVLSRLANHPEIDIVSVVHGGGWQIDFFDRYRVNLYFENQIQSRGLNETLEGAIQRAEGQQILLVFGDLPRLNEAELTEVLAVAKNHEVVLCPDRAKHGTNLMALRKSSQMQLSFGNGSFGKHKRLSIEAGLSWCSLTAVGSSNDVDNPDDLNLLMQNSSALGAATAAWRSEFKNMKT